MQKESPIAQSFKLTRDHFVTGIDLFYKSVAQSNSMMWLDIRTMENGYPTTEILSRKHFDSIGILPSEDAKESFHIELDFPVFVKGNVEYCFVIGGFSPDTRIWISKLGEEDVTVPGLIVETQPALGSSFRSQNGSTWNAEQYEDIKYKLYVAKFKQNTMDLKFDQINERELMAFNPFEGDINSKVLRVYHENHGMIKGDKFALDLLENMIFEVRVTVGQLKVGHVLTTVDKTASCTIKEIVEVVQSEDLIKIRVSNIRGNLTPATGTTIPFLCAAKSEDSNNFLVSKFTKDSIPRVYNDVVGEIIGAPLNQINGIYIENLVGEHVVLQADSTDTFTFIVSNKQFPTQSGRFGGDGIYIHVNTKYDVFNVSGAYTLNGSSEQWNFTGIGHNQYFGDDLYSGGFPTDDYKHLKAIDFHPGQDVFLEQPQKIAIGLNELDRLQTNRSSCEVRSSFVTPNEWVSPVINMDTFSIIGISNQLQTLNEAIFEDEPNGLNRFNAETDPSKGSQSYKYVTKTVFLKNPARDLMLAFDVYKDVTADFEIYLKFVSPYDNIDIDNLNWVKLNYIPEKHSVNIKDRYEVEITLSETIVSFPFNLFSAFKVKIVGTGKNSCKVPTFRSFRAIALT